LNVYLVPLILHSQFSILNCRVSAGAEKRAPIIGATCVFDAKIYKIVGGIVAVSTCGEGNKKIFKNSDFCFQLPALLVENTPNSKLKTKNSKLPSPSLLVENYGLCWLFWLG